MLHPQALRVVRIANNAGGPCYACCWSGCRCSQHCRSIEYDLELTPALATALGPNSALGERKYREERYQSENGRQHLNVVEGQ
jgi:hypothetical protein